MSTMVRSITPRSDNRFAVVVLFIVTAKAKFTLRLKYYPAGQASSQTIFLNRIRSINMIPVRALADLRRGDAQASRQLRKQK
ncbi:MAG: hypothetical protein KDJ45_00955 [Hyphomicrobiaceae bacterium]|nr:hypothetical protein [Hyphomicrobiaceae bacterium]